MPNSVAQISFAYLPDIVKALERFYQNDCVLLDAGRRTHEQTVSFRFAKYLAASLESKDERMRVDCEYHGDVYSAARRKTLNAKRIRPDIIYHDRYERNEFCIEMKIGSAKPNDFAKVHGLISNYGYREGYCICNIGKRFVTVYAISSQHVKIKKRYQLHYDTQAHLVKKSDVKQESKENI